MEDEVLLTRCINLLQKVCTLLGQTVVATELWNDTSMAARDLVSFFAHKVTLVGSVEEGGLRISFLAEITM